MRENGAQLCGARVSYFLSHQIVKSLIFMIFCKFEFQCTRNGLQNPPCWPGSIQNTFVILPRHHPIFQKCFCIKNHLGKLKTMGWESEWGGVPAAQKLITGIYFFIGGRFLEIRTPRGVTGPAQKLITGNYFSSISHHQIFQTYVANKKTKIGNVEIWKSRKSGSQQVSSFSTLGTI